MLQAHPRVVPLHDVAEVVEERFECGIILVVDVLRIVRAEGTLLQAGVGLALLVIGLIGWRHDDCRRAGILARLRTKWSLRCRQK